VRQQSLTHWSMPIHAVASLSSFTRHQFRFPLQALSCSLCLVPRYPFSSFTSLFHSSLFLSHARFFSHSFCLSLILSYSIFYVLPFHDSGHFFVWLLVNYVPVWYSSRTGFPFMSSTLLFPHLNPFLILPFSLYLFPNSFFVFLYLSPISTPLQTLRSTACASVDLRRKEPLLS
jgi:hypothetical protein